MRNRGSRINTYLYVLRIYTKYGIHTKYRRELRTNGTCYLPRSSRPQPVGPGSTPPQDWPPARSTPSPRPGRPPGRRYALDANHSELDQRAPLQSARLVIGLMVALCCRNIEPQRQVAPQALNAKRAKRGKTSIPDHFRVTVVDSRRSVPKHAGQGVKASPIPHARRGYVRARTIQGRRYVEWIGPSFVNADDDAGLAKLYRRR